MGRKKRKQLIRRIFRSALSFVLILCTIIPVSALYKEHYTPHAPKDEYGINFIVFDETMTQNVAGNYDGLMTARLSGNRNTSEGLYGGILRWYWDINLPKPVLEDAPNISGERPVEIDPESGLNMARASFQYSREADGGTFEEAENGEGYKEFRLRFNNVKAVPGQTFRVKIEDHYNKDLGENGESAFLVTPIDPNMDPVPIIRGEVIEGQLRAPGRTITYKSDENGSQTYEQIYETDEELVGKSILSLEEVGFSKDSNAKFLGWSTKPDALNEVQFSQGQPLDTKGNDGRYLVENVTLYPVWETEEHLDDYWVDYIVSDTTAVNDTNLADGYYNATLDVRMVADMQRLSGIHSGSLEWSWPKRLGEDPELLNMPESTSDIPNYTLPEDAGLNLISHRRFFKWFSNPDRGALTPMNDGSGYGYQEFQMRFENFKGDPGEVISNIRVRDYIKKSQVSSMVGIDENREEVDTVRCHVKTGSIRIPGIKITYLSDDTENARKYEQIFYSDEGVAAGTILNNDPTQNANQPLTMPNFEAPKGKDFAGWSTTSNDTTAMYQPGDPLDMGNTTLYPVWTNKDSYTITYDGNGGIPERFSDEVLIGESIDAADMPMATHDEKYIFLGWFTDPDGGQKIEGTYTPSGDTTLYAHWETTYNVFYSAGNGTGEVIDENSPYQVGDTVTAKNGDGLTPPEGKGWSFKEWESNVPLNVQGKTETKVFAGQKFIMPEQDVTLTAVWSNSISDICPLVLDLSNETLINKKGEAVVKGFVNTGRTIAVVQEAFQDCTAEHIHELKVVGSTDKKVELEGTYEVYVDGVTAKNFNLGNAGNVTFGSDGSVMTSTFHADGDKGLVIGADVKSIKVNDGVMVVGTSDSKTRMPIEGVNSKAKILDLSMYEKINATRTIEINGKEVVLPENDERISVLDNTDGAWLVGDVAVTDGNRSYVRGLAQDENDKYASGVYSEKNIYGDKFPLSGTDNEVEGTGYYEAVRLPKNIKQLTISVPTRVVFNIYTEKADQNDAGFIGPQYEMKNESYTCEDEIQYNNETLMFNQRESFVDVSYSGINKNAVKENMYMLRKYETMDTDIMEQSVDKPVVCLEMSANGGNRVSLDEKNSSVESWFKAPVGISKIELKRPASYEQSTDPNVKRYYQVPKLVEEEEMILRGYHTVKLGFRIQ